MEDIISPNDTVIAVPYNNSPGGERAEKAIDGKTNTKFLTWRHKRHGLIILTKGGIVKSMSLTTGNDAPDRDPSTYLILGSNNLYTTSCKLLKFN